MSLLHVSFNLEFTLCVYINILWAWDQILSLSVKMIKCWRTQNSSYWQRISEISCSFVYWLLVANNSKCKIIQPLQPVQKAESVSFSALGNTWNPPGDPGKAHSTLTFSFVLFFSSHCPAYMNSEGHTILLVFPPVTKYTGAKALLEELSYKISLNPLQLQQSHKLAVCALLFHFKYTLPLEVTL